MSRHLRCSASSTTSRAGWTTGCENSRSWSKAPATRVSALTMVGIIHNRQGRVHEAIRAFEQALLTDSEAAVAANNLAWIYASQGRELDRAMKLAAMAKRRIPGDPDVADTLAWIYYLKGVPALARDDSRGVRSPAAAESPVPLSPRRGARGAEEQ